MQPSSLELLRTVLRELLGRRARARSAEPALIMSDPSQVAAFHHAGRVDGSMASLYLFNSLHASQVIRPGDRVVDLGCGSGVQLLQTAALNPEARFVGVDLSPAMLATAQQAISSKRLDNVETLCADISLLDALEDDSVDAVISSVALHHLPDEAAFERTFAHIARILRPNGGLYLIDFGMLKAERSVRYFAARSAPFVEEPLFLADYVASMNAGFASRVWRELARRHFGPRISVRRTFGIDFMITAKSAARSLVDVPTQAVSIVARMTAEQRRDLVDLRRYFGLGGLRTPDPFASLAGDQSPPARPSPGR